MVVLWNVRLKLKFFEGNSSYFSVSKSALKTREFSRPNFAKVPFPIQHFLQTYPPPISQSYWPGSYFLTEENSSFLFNLPDPFRILEKYQELRLCLIKISTFEPLWYCWYLHVFVYKAIVEALGETENQFVLIKTWTNALLLAKIRISWTRMFIRANEGLKNIVRLLSMKSSQSFTTLKILKPKLFSLSDPSCPCRVVRCLCSHAREN